MCTVKAAFGSVSSAQPHGSPSGRAPELRGRQPAGDSEIGTIQAMLLLSASIQIYMRSYCTKRLRLVQKRQLKIVNSLDKSARSHSQGLIVQLMRWTQKLGRIYGCVLSDT